MQRLLSSVGLDQAAGPKLDMNSAKVMKEIDEN